MKTLRKRRAQKIGFTVDLLGEAVLSEKETDEYAARCLDLLECLSRETRDWTDPLGKNSGLFPVVNLSVKISALYSQMNPADPTDAIAHLAPKLRPILRRAREIGAFIASGQIAAVLSLPNSWRSPHCFMSVLLIDFDPSSKYVQYVRTQFR